MSCIHCGKPSIYKCPICRQPYCSVVCCKIHKVTPCLAPLLPDENLPEEPQIDYEFPTEDTVPLDKLNLLGQSTEVKKCLENPHLRKILEILDKSPHPDLLIEEYMQEPLFTEFVDACLKIVQTHED